MPLFAIDPDRTVHVFCAEIQISPKAGWSVVYMRQPDRRKSSRKRIAASSPRPMIVEQPTLSLPAQ
ncbi:MAG: hypothetical protein EOM10_17945 [Opitutae bacterium]|nr:hypothetical protein [Opitutae bacterium]